VQAQGRSIQLGNTIASAAVLLAVQESGTALGLPAL